MSLRPLCRTSFNLYIHSLPHRPKLSLPPASWPRSASTASRVKERRIQLARTSINSSSTTLAIFVGVTLLAVAASFLVGTRAGIEHHSHPSLEPDEDLEAHSFHIMPGTVLPGRPGNLTSDQEAKLKELWTATLRVFGVAPLSEESKSLEDADQRSRADTIASEKQKKKRMGLFSKKHKNEETDGAISDFSVNADDKWGQTKEFQSVLANQSPEDLRTAFWSMVKHDNPDGLLLRFLRARKWDVQNALIMMVATMHWRLQEMHVDNDIMIKGEGGALEETKSSNASVKKEGEDFLAQERLGKSFLRGTDKEGRPICFVRSRLHRKGEQSEQSLERYTVFVIETCRLVLAPPVDTAVSLFAT